MQDLTNNLSLFRGIYLPFTRGRERTGAVAVVDVSQGREGLVV